MEEKRDYYTEAQKRATYAFREKNRDAYNAYQRAYHAERMRCDIDYRNRKAKQSIEANRRSRERKEAIKIASLIIQKEKDTDTLVSSLNADIITTM